ncbi:MAG TPA: hypothetical protein VMX75_10115 [Spirochaetia bacterium]|nr:hypothetical protein [Spirochaetia bacterium]
MELPQEAENLLVTCFNRQDGQFRGVWEVCQMLSGRPGCCHITFKDQNMLLSGRKNLGWVLLSGHGVRDEARVGDDRGGGITPPRLRLPPGAHLLLLCCYQGREDLRSVWARQTGAKEERVWGSSGETESALSTLYLLHLLEGERLPDNDGRPDYGGQPVDDDRALYWFRRWIQANAYYRSHFPRARKLYRETGGDFLKTLDLLRTAVDTDRFEDFFSPAERYMEFLDRLGPS